MKAEPAKAVVLVADAGRPTAAPVLEDPYPALFAMIRVVTELASVDASDRPATIGVFRL